MKKQGILFIILIILSYIKNINSYKCEGLVSDLCTTAYPLCKLLLIESCCAGSLGVCVNVQADINNAFCSSEMNPNEIHCLRNRISNTVYEIRGNVTGFQFESYDIYPPPNDTCATVDCERKGLDCIIAIDECESKSPCCRPQPKCIERNNFSRVTKGDGNCALPCQKGFVCRLLIDRPACLPVSCDYLECPKYTECIELQGVGLVSCFSKLFADVSDSDEDETHETCETKRCPENFECRKGVFSDHDCIPKNIELIGLKFDCNTCPKDWRCDSFGWGGLCIEWFPEIHGDCFAEKCLKNQFCNQLAKECQYHPCTNTTCHDDLTCVQYQPSHPRVCATNNILPFTTLPESLMPFPPNDV